MGNVKNKKDKKKGEKRQRSHLELQHIYDHPADNEESNYQS